MAEQKGPRGFQIVEEEEAERTRSLPPLTFGAFVLMLQASARVQLGESSAPEQDAPGEPDLELAHQTIDILAMLEEKTVGNLEPEEKQLLESVLHALRMRYVELRDARK